MKGLGGFAVIILLGLAAYNWWQVRELSDKVARLEVKVAEQQQGGGVADQTVAQAVRAIAQAKDAIGAVNMDSARGALNRAGDFLAQAGKTVGDKSAPTVNWLREQANSLSKQVQEKMK